MSSHVVSAALACGLVAAQFLLGHASVHAHSEQQRQTADAQSMTTQPRLTASPTKKKSGSKSAHAQHKKTDHSADHDEHASKGTDAKSGHNGDGTKLAKTDTKTSHDDLKTGGSDDPLEGL